MTEEDLKRGRKLSDQIQRYKYLMESFDQSKAIGTPIQVGNTVVVTRIDGEAYTTIMVLIKIHLEKKLNELETEFEKL